MTELAKYSGIDSLRLNRRQYFTSLLAEGQRLGLVSERDGARLQGESLTLLAERVQVWSRGESSSLPVEAAQELLASVLYAVSAALLTRAAPEQALADVLTSNCTTRRQRRRKPTSPPTIRLFSACLRQRGSCSLRPICIRCPMRIGSVGILRQRRYINCCWDWTAATQKP